MLTITKKKLEIEPKLLSRIKWACQFGTKDKPIIVHGSLRVIDKTNLAYIEPHKVFVNNSIYLFFNGIDYFYKNDLTTKIPLKNLEEYIRNHWCTSLLDSFKKLIIKMKISMIEKLLVSFILERRKNWVS